MLRRRPSARSSNLLRFVLLALCALLAQSALGASTPRNAAASSPTDRDSVEQAGIRWQGASYTSVRELRADLIARGGNWERFLRVTPAVVRAFELRPVRWDGASFYSRSGIAARLSLSGQRYDAWSRNHPVARMRLMQNEAAVLQRQTSAVASVSVPSGRAAVADTFLDSTKQNASFGQAERLAVETSRAKHAYFRFNVANLTSSVRKATLHVYSTGSTASSVQVWEVTGNWSESSTWKSRPALGRQLQADLVHAGADSWASVDVTSLVTGNGPVDLSLVAQSGATAASFASREAGRAAVLAIETETDATPVADTQAPTAPTALAVSGQTQTTITLAWRASTDAVGVTGYGSYQGGILAGSGAGTGFGFAGLSCGTSYSLAVDAFDAAGNRSAKASLTASTSACSAPPPADTQAPTAPSSLVPSGQTQTSIALAWNPSTDSVGVTGYGLYREGTFVGSGGATSYTFSGLTCGTSYSLSVDGHDAAGNRSAQGSTTASTNACPSLPPSAVWTRLFGFSNGNRKSSQDDFRQSVGIGATLLRVDAQWAYMEPARGSYDWSSWDTVVANAKATGGKLIACIAYTPSWARSSGTSIFQEPNDANEADYARFAGAFASRYAESGVLVAVEIWNEPNLSGFWKPRPNPAKYTRMLQLAYASIKQAAPSLEVMTAGLSPAGSYSSHPLGGVDVNPVRYLEAIYANGGQGEFDSVGHHPYDFGGAPTTTNEASAWYQMFGTTPSLRSLMMKNGDGAKRIHATEFGIPSQLSAYGNSFSEEKQRQMIDASVRAWKTFSWAGHFASYLQKDGINGGDGTWFYHYGLLKADGTPKPAWWAFRDAIR